MDLDDVYKAAVEARSSGSTRFCMGAAWRGPSQVFVFFLDSNSNLIPKPYWTLK